MPQLAWQGRAHDSHATLRAAIRSFAFWLLWIGTLGAQSRPNTHVTLVGMVHDTLGRAVPGALVRVRRSAVSVQSDTAGRFTVPVLAGAIVIEVSRDGFPPLAIDVNIRSADRDTLDVFLFGALPARQSSTVLASSGDQRGIDSAPRLDSARAETSVRRRPRTLRGYVTDTTGRALAGAIVELTTQQRSVVTDSTGSYELSQLSAGAVLVRVRRIGFAPRTFTTNISAVDAVIVDIPLVARGQVLSRVTVSSDAVRRNTKLNGFFERKSSGFGQFITRDQFEARNLLRFSDIFNTMTGVVAAQDSRGRRRLYGRGRCEMSIFLDGMNIIIPDGTSVDDFLDLYEIDAVEVHNRVTGLPAEFSGRANACGVVAAWTKVRSSK